LGERNDTDHVAVSKAPRSARQETPRGAKPHGNRRVDGAAAS